VRRRWIAAGAAVAVLTALLVAAGTISLGPANGNPNTLSQGGDAKAGLTALERSGIGDGALSPIEILTRGSDPTQLARRLQALPGVQGASAPATAGWHQNERALVDVLAHTDSSHTVDRVHAAAH
jgi:RND superfamily putative drug exporter